MSSFGLSKYLLNVVSITIVILTLCNWILVETAITTVSPQQLGKLEQCANETYECIFDNSETDQQTFCCCIQPWFNCRRNLGCENGKARHPESCRFLANFDRYFKKPKDKECTKIEEQCSRAYGLESTLLMSCFSVALVSMFASNSH